MDFEYSLEQNLQHLQTSLVKGKYIHGGYITFEVSDSKRRQVAVAAVRDRIVHRLLYDYLVPVWDKTFIFDAWSCRKGKGQHQAIARAASFMQRYQRGYIWRADVAKFFDSVDQQTLFSLVARRVKDEVALALIQEVLSSYSKNELGRGMPIGNLTSQIFANIYLNEFDRFMVHELKPYAYLRYGDDWLCFTDTKKEATRIQTRATDFLTNTLKLSISSNLNFISPVYRGTTYLGIDLWPDGKRITRTTLTRAYGKLRPINQASYESLIKQFSNRRALKRFHWRTLDLD